MMLNWLKRWLIGKPICEHQWVQTAEYTVESRFTGSIIRYVHLLKCEKCGDLKNHFVRMG